MKSFLISPFNRLGLLVILATIGIALWQHFSGRALAPYEAQGMLIGVIFIIAPDSSISRKEAQQMLGDTLQLLAKPTPVTALQVAEDGAKIIEQADHPTQETAHVDQPSLPLHP